MNRRRLLSTLTASGLLAATSAPVVTGRLGSNGPYSLRVETDHDDADGLVLENRVVDDRIEQTDPGVVEFEAINRNEESVRISSGLPAPFGVLSGYRSGRPVVTLWSESYERESGVKTQRTTVTDVVEVGKSTTLEPTESVSETYELGPSYDRFRSGTAAVRTFGGDRLFERTAPLEAELVIEEE